VPRGHFRVCNIQSPTTGLEAKFSLRLTTAMALARRDTSAIDAYTDQLVHDPAMIGLRDRVEVVAREDGQRGSKVSIRTNRGTVERDLDIGVPNRDLDAQWVSLGRKFAALVAPRLGDNAARRIEAYCRELDAHTDLTEFFGLIRGDA